MAFAPHEFCPTGQPWTCSGHDAPRIVNAQRLALVVAAVQFFLALSWTMYVVCLPRLAAEAGIEPVWVPWVLVAGQLVFAACDWAAGVWSDRVARTVGRLGQMVAIATAISCIAFLVLPFTAPGNQELFLAAVFLWSATSSALRAPPLTLLGRHAPKRSHPFLAMVLLCGFGIAGAASPALAGLLHDVDAHIPFALASAGLFAAAWALSRADRNLPRASQPRTSATADAGFGTMAWFVPAMFLLGLAFHIHFRSTPNPRS
jgi:MFS family permease